jgi:mRNA interferase MazF
VTVKRCEIYRAAKDSKIKADQIRTLDKSRVVKRIGALDKKDVAAIDKAMKIHLALPCQPGVKHIA